MFKKVEIDGKPVEKLLRPRTHAHTCIETDGPPVRWLVPPVPSTGRTDT